MDSLGCARALTHKSLAESVLLERRGGEEGGHLETDFGGF